MTNPTRQERRAAERRAAKRSAVRIPPTPYFAKLQSKLPRATLAELVSLLKRFTKARRNLGFAFKRWKRETEGRLPDDQWPDRDALVSVALCYSAVVDQLAHRGTKLSPPTVEIGGQRLPLSIDEDIEPAPAVTV